MDFVKIETKDFEELKELQMAYKDEIGEDTPMEEDFYIRPEFRHKGIARKLVAFAWEQSGVGSLTVGCADCDVEMYKAIGFEIPLGNMLAFSE